MLKLIKNRARNPALEVLAAFKAKAVATRHGIAEEHEKLERLDAVDRAGRDATRAAEAAKETAAKFRKQWLRDGCKHSESRELQCLDDVAAEATRVAERATKDADSARPESARTASAIESLRVDLRGWEKEIAKAAGVIVSEEETGALIDQLEQAFRQFCQTRLKLRVLESVIDPKGTGNAGGSPIWAALARCEVKSYSEERSSARSHDFVAGQPGADDAMLERIAAPYRARLEQLLDDQQ